MMPYKDIEKQRACCRERNNKRYATDPEFRAKQNERNKERYATDLKYRKKRRESVKERLARMRLKAPWVFHWKKARQRCLDPSCNSYKWYGGKGIRMLLTKLEVEILYKRDHADRMKRSSIDRINSNGDYIFSNCRFMEMSENSKRARCESIDKEPI